MTMFQKYDIINSILRGFLLKNIVLKSKSIFLIFSIFALFSCKNTTESKLVYTENDTVKSEIKNREGNITWTFDIEEERLSSNISRTAWPLAENVPYSPDYLRLSKKFQKAVFPELLDFGSLDTSSMRQSAKEKINNFCTKLSSAPLAEAGSFFNSKYIFSYVFFRQELENGWTKNFKQEIPVIKAPEKKAESEKSDDENSEEEAEPEITIFNKWMIGQPFTGNDIMQIPVRFYCNYGTIDVTIYMNPNGNNEFYQITIDRWEKV